MKERLKDPVGLAVRLSGGRLSARFVRYFIVGVAGLAADYVSFLICLYVLNISLHWAVLIGLVIGFAVNFTLNKLWAFGTKQARHNTIAQLAMYSGLFAFNYAFTYYGIRFMEHHGIPAGIGKIITTALAITWNYFIYKLAIFRENIDIPVIE